MKVASPAHGFAFDSAPSSPRRPDDLIDLIHCCCTSAPSSPIRAAAIYEHLCTHGQLLRPPPLTSGVPFIWEEKPGTPKSHAGRSRTQVDSLFEEGHLIPPLKLPPRLQYPAIDDQSGVTSSPRARGLWTSGGNQQRRGTGEAELDPFTIAMVEATREAGPTTTSTFLGQSKRAKWKLRELLLFRGASSDIKYTLLSSSSSSNKKVAADDVARKELEANGEDCCGEERAADEEIEKKIKKTALRQRQGLLSCIRFNPGGHCYNSSRVR